MRQQFDIPAVPGQSTRPDQCHEDAHADPGPYDPGVTDLSCIHALEERAFNAWPALRTLTVGGWLVRVSGGYTKRANSVSALAPSIPFEDVRSAAEAIFARQSLPTIFRLSPLAPKPADRALEKAGYRAIDPSLVMTAAIEGSGLPSTARVMDAPGPGWLPGFARAAPVDETQRSLHDAMIAAIALPTAFATVTAGGQPVAFGLGVCERGMIGIFDVIVVPAHRGHGHGRSITQALLAWGSRVGAERAYLQVGLHNEAARRLYAGLGFREAYRYHYRRRPD